MVSLAGGKAGRLAAGEGRATGAVASEPWEPGPDSLREFRPTSARTHCNRSSGESPGSPVGREWTGDHSSRPEESHKNVGQGGLPCPPRGVAGGRTVFTPTPLISSYFPPVLAASSCSRRRAPFRMSPSA